MVTVKVEIIETETDAELLQPMAQFDESRKILTVYINRRLSADELRYACKELRRYHAVLRKYDFPDFLTGVLKDE